MDIFLSWKGTPSHRLAAVLKKWLPKVMPYVRPWLSSGDIRKGARWTPELAERLQDTTYSIVCVTGLDVARSPWVNFEAGAVSKIIDGGHVSPLLVGVIPDDLGDLPLSMFQCTTFDRGDVGRLLRSINRASAERSISDTDLENRLHRHWQDLQTSIDGIELQEPATNDDQSDLSRVSDDDLRFLEEVEEDILRFLADSEPKMMTTDAIVAHIGEHHTRVRHFLERLDKAELVYSHHFYTGDPTKWGLTPRGRRQLVEDELL